MLEILKHVLGDGKKTNLGIRTPSNEKIASSFMIKMHYDIIEIMSIQKKT